MGEDAGAPIRTLTYAVARADALAWTVLRHELTGWDKLRLLLLISVAGLAAGMVPRTLDPVTWWSIVLGILGAAAVAAIVWTNVDVRRKAAALPIMTGPATLMQWQDRLTEHRSSGRRDVDIDRITQVVVTERHLFIREGAVPLIIPVAAFRDLEDMRAFAADLDEKSKQAVA
jgi:hypothetical protein